MENILRQHTQALFKFRLVKESINVPVSRRLNSSVSCFSLINDQMFISQLWKQSGGRVPWESLCCSHLTDEIYFAFKFRASQFWLIQSKGLAQVSVWFWFQEGTLFSMTPVRAWAFSSHMVSFPHAGAVRSNPAASLSFQAGNLPPNKQKRKRKCEFIPENTNKVAWFCSFQIFTHPFL